MILPKSPPVLPLPSVPIQQPQTFANNVTLALSTSTLLQTNQLLMKKIALSQHQLTTPKTALPLRPMEPVGSVKKDTTWKPLVELRNAFQRLWPIAKGSTNWLP